MLVGVRKERLAPSQASGRFHGRPGPTATPPLAAVHHPFNKSYMNLDTITPLILTYNEAPNIARCLNGLTWAKRIVVLDSCSPDETAAIAQAYPAVDVRERRFDTLATQWNFGLNETDIDTEWVLALDCDYTVSPELVKELEQLDPGSDTTAFEAKFFYCVYGQRLRSGVYPPVKVLFRRNRCHYSQDGHAHRLVVREGQIQPLLTPVGHDDRKSLVSWLASQSKYMDLEVRKLSVSPLSSLSKMDRIRKRVFLAPFVMLAYCLLYRGGLWEGWAGWFYAFQRMGAELILSLKLLEAKYNPHPEAESSPRHSETQKSTIEAAR